MFMVPTKIALRFRAEAHSWGRQYKWKKTCFSLQAITGESDHHWAVYNAGEKRHHRTKGVLLLQKHTSSACSRPPQLRNGCLNRISAAEGFLCPRHFSGNIFIQSPMLRDGSVWGNPALQNGRWWQPCSTSWCISSGGGERCTAEGLLGVVRDARLQQFLGLGIELVQRWNKAQIFSYLENTFLSINLF